MEWRRLSWAGHVDRMKEGRRDFKIETGRPTGKRLLGWGILAGMDDNI